MPLVSLQYLRGIAALMVVCVHLQVQVERMGYAGAWPDWAASGVDIFFVLSGFLMWSTTVGRAQGLLEFYRRRIVRILPLYWLLTSVAVAVMVAAPRLMQSVRFDAVNVICSYLFLFSPAANGRMEPVLVVGWTLNYEMLFYLIYGAALMLPAGMRFGATAGAIVALVGLGYTSLASNPLVQTYTSSIMLEFVFGMAIAYVWKKLPPHVGGACLAGLLALVAGFAGVVLLGGWLPQLPRAGAAGVSAAVVVAGALMVERSGRLPRLPPLRWLGDISYSLYLSHPIALSAFAQVWRKLGLHQTLPYGIAVFCVVALVVCIAVGGVVYRWLELPMTRRFGARTGVNPQPAALA